MHTVWAEQRAYRSIWGKAPRTSVSIFNPLQDLHLETSQMCSWDSTICKPAKPITYWPAATLCITSEKWHRTTHMIQLCTYTVRPLLTIPFLLNIVANPKSQIFRLSCSSSRIFSGFRSRCAMPRLWRYSWLSTRNKQELVQLPYVLHPDIIKTVLHHQWMKSLG